MLKKIIVLLTLMFLLSFVVSYIDAAEPQKLIYDLDWGGDKGINVKIYVPYQAYPNDNMMIRIIVDPRENLTDVNVILEIYGSMNEGKADWSRQLDALKNRNMDSVEFEDQYFNVSTENADPGLLHGYIHCSWKVWRNSSWQEQSNDFDVHRVTYLKNKLYEDLQVAYAQLLANYSSLLGSYNQLRADYSFLRTSYDDLENSYTYLQGNHSALLTDYDRLLTDYNDLNNSYSGLQANHSALLTDYNTLQTSYDSLNFTYYSLLSNYTSLQSSFNELKSKYEFAGEIASSLNLMYVFIEMTIVFIATTIYFARARIYSALRKPKPRQQT